MDLLQLAAPLCNRLLNSLQYGKDHVPVYSVSVYGRDVSGAAAVWLGTGASGWTEKAGWCSESRTSTAGGEDGLIQYLFGTLTGV